MDRLFMAPISKACRCMYSWQWYLFTHTNTVAHVLTPPLPPPFQCRRKSCSAQFTLCVFCFLLLFFVCLFIVVVVVAVVVVLLYPLPTRVHACVWIWFFSSHLQKDCGRTSKMAWRFKVSKYKNAAPKFPKKEVIILLICMKGNSHWHCHLCCSSSSIAMLATSSPSTTYF